MLFYTFLSLKGLYLKEDTASVCFRSGINPYRHNAIESSDEIPHTTIVSGFILIKRASFFSSAASFKMSRMNYGAIANLGGMSCISWNCLTNPCNIPLQFYGVFN